MKNKEIVEMLVRLDDAVRGFEEDIRTEGDKPAMLGCSGNGMVHLYEGALVEFFGSSTAEIIERQSDSYPVEASYTYKGVKFFAIMSRARAKELFGYDSDTNTGGAE